MEGMDPDAVFGAFLRQYGDDHAALERAIKALESGSMPDEMLSLGAQVAEKKACGGCGATESGGAVLKTCKGCGSEFYCSKECQRKSWKTHKFVCREKSPMHCDYCGQASNSYKTCSRCKEAIYCNKECQRQAWKSHKEFCQEGNSAFGKYGRPGKYDYCYANSPSRDVLLLEQLEGCGDDPFPLRNLKVYMSGFCDLRNVLNSLSSLCIDQHAKDALPGGVEQIEFVLQDLNPSVCNKTLLLLLVLLEFLCDPGDRAIWSKDLDEEFLLDFFFDIWYSVGLTDEQAKLLRTICGAVSKCSFSPSKGGIRISEVHSPMMQSMALGFSPFALYADYFDLLQSAWPPLELVLRQRSVINASMESVKDRFPGFSEENLASLASFDKYGFTQANSSLVCQANPFQLNAVEDYLRYAMAPGQNPFDGATMLELEKHGQSLGLWPDVMASYRSLVKSWVRGTVSNVRALRSSLDAKFGSMSWEEMEQYEDENEEEDDDDERAPVKIYLNQGDVTEGAKYIGALCGPFHRIHLSNLGDWFGCESLVAAHAKNLCRKNPHAVLITDSMNWKTPGFPLSREEFCNDDALMWHGFQKGTPSEMELRSKMMESMSSIFPKCIAALAQGRGTGMSIEEQGLIAENLAYFQPIEFEHAMTKRFQAKLGDTFELRVENLAARPVRYNLIYKVTEEELRAKYRYEFFNRHENHLEWRVDRGAEKKDRKLRPKRKGKKKSSKR